jgi:hypothetical protein
LQPFYWKCRQKNSRIDVKKKIKPHCRFVSALLSSYFCFCVRITHSLLENTLSCTIH